MTDRLEKKWSPEQKSGWLKITYPGDAQLQISNETIYKSLFIQTQGLFQKQLRSHLRTHQKFRHAKKHKVGSRGRIVDGISISEKPPCVEDSAVPRHWEGDLIVGSRDSYIAAVVERHSRFVVLVTVDGKDTTSVVTALAEQMAKLPKLLWQSLAWDRGTELASHA